MKSLALRLCISTLALTASTGCRSSNGGNSTVNANLVRVSGDAPASDCPLGGILLDAGLDENGNGELEPEEILNTYTVCEGAIHYDELIDAPALASVALSGDFQDLTNVPDESDPAFSMSPAASIGTNQIGNWNGVYADWVASGASWDAAFSWGNHAAEGYLTSEADPAFTASVAASISATEVGNWSNVHADWATNGDAWNGADARLTKLEALVDVLTKTVFITSGAFSGDLVSAAQAAFPGCTGVTGGVEAADCICQQSAQGASLSGNFRAWIADNTTASAPINRFVQTTKPYVLVDLTPIAADWTDLTDGTLQAPINRTQTGGLFAATNRVWTNVGTPGDRFNGTNTCSNWTDTAGPIGVIGFADASNGDWTSPGFGQVCSDIAHLYCFEQ